MELILYLLSQVDYYLLAFNYIGVVFNLLYRFRPFISLYSSLKPSLKSINNVQFKKYKLYSFKTIYYKKNINLFYFVLIIMDSDYTHNIYSYATFKNIKENLVENKILLYENISSK